MRLGEYQELRIERESPYGLYLSDGRDEVLLPSGQCPPRARLGESLRVFLYTDSEDRPVATMKKPVAVVGEFARMRVVAVTQAGAFLDWGLDKDLFCPLREQKPKMREGGEYVVYVYLDELTQRVVCTTRLNRHLSKEGFGLTVGQPVQIMIIDRTPEMMIVIVDGKIKGALFADEWHGRLEFGDTRDAFVKQVRQDDGRVAVSLRPQGYQALMGERERLLKTLRSNGGLLLLSDKSSPEAIQKVLGLSKGAFKKLVGALYKEGIIDIEARLIRLKERGSNT